MYYTIYQITNTVTEKIYIGKHQTLDLMDGYMGSGKHLKRAQEKYGIENFSKEILFVFDNESNMNKKEEELVTEEFCARQDTYNICPGGRGGWQYVNSAGLGNKNKSANTKKKLSEIQSANMSNYAKNNPEMYNKMIANLVKITPETRAGLNPFLGRKHTEETKRKIGERSKLHQTGKSNSQYGTIWVTNGVENRKMKKGSQIPEGWYRGRTAKSL